MSGPLIFMKYLVLVLLVVVEANAAGPEKIATYDRVFWPEAVDGVKAFDRASRFEIYHFLDELSGIDTKSEKAVAEFTGVKSPDMKSIQEWETFIEKMLVDNYKLSCSSSSNKIDEKCNNINTSEELLGSLKTEYQNLGDDYTKWKELSRKFHSRYIYEQLRLAALFPGITSEILKLSDNEINGFEFQDKQFLLSFDDGPSRNGVTEKLIGELEAQNTNAIFFLLGERLDGYQPEIAREVYKRQCVSSHGYTHKAHPKYDKWKTSIDKTHALISDLFKITPDNIWFRPPYGQRNNEIVAYLRENHSSRVMLWNVDSQDWNRKISAEDMTNRLTTLILLWRKGILLFHDLYPKSIETVRALHNFSMLNDIEFVNCKNITK